MRFTDENLGSEKDNRRRFYAAVSGFNESPMRIWRAIKWRRRRMIAITTLFVYSCRVFFFYERWIRNRERGIQRENGKKRRRWRNEATKKNGAVEVRKEPFSKAEFGTTGTLGGCTPFRVGSTTFELHASLQRRSMVYHGVHMILRHVYTATKVRFRRSGCRNVK